MRLSDQLGDRRLDTRSSVHLLYLMPPQSKETDVVSAMPWTGRAESSDMSSLIPHGLPVTVNVAPSGRGTFSLESTRTGSFQGLASLGETSDDSEFYSPIPEGYQRGSHRFVIV